MVRARQLARLPLLAQFGEQRFLQPGNVALGVPENRFEARYRPGAGMLRDAPLHGRRVIVRLGRDGQGA